MTEETNEPCDCINCTLVQPFLEDIARQVNDFCMEHKHEDDFCSIEVMEKIAHYGLQHVIGAHLYSEYMEGVPASDAGRSIGTVLTEIVDEAMKAGQSHASTAIDSTDITSEATHHVSTRRDN